MGEATTPRSRRAMWGTDALRFAEDMRASTRGGFGPPWRTAYVAGFRLVEESDETFTIEGARTSPHRKTTFPIGKRAERLPSHVIDLVCWTHDQEVARMVETENGDDPCPLPAGPLLVDRVTAALLATGDVGEWDLRGAIDEEEAKTSQRVHASLRLPQGRLAMKVGFHMNALQPSYDLPGGGSWNCGRLTLALPALPETIKIAARGRRVADLVHHAIAMMAPDLHISGIMQAPDGTATIMTDAMTPERMTTLRQGHTMRTTA